MTFWSWTALRHFSSFTIPGTWTWVYQEKCIHGLCEKDDNRALSSKWNLEWLFLKDHLFKTKALEMKHYSHITIRLTCILKVLFPTIFPFNTNNKQANKKKKNTEPFQSSRIPWTLYYFLMEWWLCDRMHICFGKLRIKIINQKQPWRCFIWHLRHDFQLYFHLCEICRIRSCQSLIIPGLVWYFELIS